MNSNIAQNPCPLLQLPLACKSNIIRPILEPFLAELQIPVCIARSPHDPFARVAMQETTTRTLQDGPIHPFEHNRGIEERKIEIRNTPQPDPASPGACNQLGYFVGHTLPFLQPCLVYPLQLRFGAFQSIAGLLECAGLACLPRSQQPYLVLRRWILIHQVLCFFLDPSSPSILARVCETSCTAHGLVVQGVLWLVSATS